MDERDVRAVLFPLLPLRFMGIFFRSVGVMGRQMEEVVVDTVRRAWNEALEPKFGDPPASRVNPAGATGTPSNIVSDREDPTKTGDGRAWTGPTEPTKEKNMADTNLNDDMVKLVQYAIVSIERRDERILTGAVAGDEKLGQPMTYLETGNITGDGFSNARIADWVRDNPGAAKDMDLDSLRVYYDVVARWPRSSLKFQEERLDQEDEKLELLKQIAQKG